MSDLDKNNQFDIERSELFSVIWSRKLLISFITSLFAIGSVLYAISLPNIYSSYGVLAPAQGKNAASSLLNQYSGMASLAGISLGSNNTDRSSEAIERMRSYDFFSEIILPEINYENLVAVEAWELSSNTIIYDDQVFNNNNKKWVNGMPSYQDGYEIFNDILDIYQDKKTFFISISIKHKSPYISKSWTELVIKKINSSMRDIERNNTSKSVEFLNNQIKKVSYSEIREAIASIQETQIRSLMLIESNEDYIFKTLNTPIVPEKKSEPKRSIIAILGTILGFFISLAIVLVHHFFNIYKK